VVSREQKREAVSIAREHVSERRACEIIELHRTVFRHTPIGKDVELEDRIRRIAEKKRRFGYRRIYLELRKGEKINHKKVYRLYRNMGLKYRIKHKKKRYQGVSVPIIIPQRINERWSMDFITDSLYDGRKFRVFNLIDDCSREAIIQHPDFSIGGTRLVRIFEDIKRHRSLPKQIVCDNGTEFTSKAFMKWATDNNVEIHFIDKGKPMQNAFVESFNGKFRDECLNEEWFLTINDARKRIKEWSYEYNSERAHSGLNGLTPYEFISQTA
jgi:putative transposase